MSCTNSVASEDFADFIAPYFTTPEEFIRSQGTDCIDFVNSTLAVVYVPLSTVTPSTYTSYTYSAVPKLYSGCHKYGCCRDHASGGASGAEQSGRGSYCGICGYGDQLYRFAVSECRWKYKNYWDMGPDK